MEGRGERDRRGEPPLLGDGIAHRLLLKIVWKNALLSTKKKFQIETCYSYRGERMRDDEWAILSLSGEEE